MHAPEKSMAKFNELPCEIRQLIWHQAVRNARRRRFVRLRDDFDERLHVSHEKWTHKILSDCVELRTLAVGPYHLCVRIHSEVRPTPSLCMTKLTTHRCIGVEFFVIDPMQCGDFVFIRDLLGRTREIDADDDMPCGRLYGWFCTHRFPAAPFRAWSPL